MATDAPGPQGDGRARSLIDILHPGSGELGVPNDEAEITAKTLVTANCGASIPTVFFVSPSTRPG